MNMQIRFMSMYRDCRFSGKGKLVVAKKFDLTFTVFVVNFSRKQYVLNFPILFYHAYIKNEGSMQCRAGLSLSFSASKL